MLSSNILQPTELVYGLSSRFTAQRQVAYLSSSREEEMMKQINGGENEY